MPSLSTAGESDTCKACHNGSVAPAVDALKTKFKTADAVAHLYHVKQSAADYSTFENRFFKLRKKLYDYFHTTPPEVHPVFTHQEIELHEVKTLAVNGKYQELLPLIATLEKRLWEENIFELLPELLEMYIHTHQVLQKFEENEILYNKLDLAQELFCDIVEAKKLARKIYEVNLIAGVKATAPYLQKLQRLSIHRAKYPRFKLIYNLVSAIHKLGGGGLDHRHDAKITNRFISVIKNIHAVHPLMPDYKFTSGYTETQHYMFRNLEVMNQFNGHNFREAAKLMTALYNDVMKLGSEMRRIKGIVFFTSTSSVQIAGEYYSEALQTAKDCLHYLMENKDEQYLHKAYTEVANAHIWMHPKPSGFSDAFIHEKLDHIIKVEKSNHPFFLTKVVYTKVGLFVLEGKYAEAEKLFVKGEVHQCFIEQKIAAEALHIIRLLKDKKLDKKTIEKELQIVNTLKLKCFVPPDYVHCIFLEKVLKGLL
jgi:hypothetical protein